MEGLKIKVKNLNDGIRKLLMRGVIDGHTSPTFEKALDDTIEDNVSKIILDFGEVSYMSSSGVGVLISVQSKLDDEFGGSGKMVLMRASDSVKDVFNILEIGGAFDFVKEEKDAVAALMQ